MVVEKKTNIREWYVNNPLYKDDELGLELNPYATFTSVMQGMRKGKDFYEMIGVGDSIIRERIFCMLSQLYAKGDYGEIYNLWLYGKDNVSLKSNCMGKSKRIKV